MSKNEKVELHEDEIEAVSGGLVVVPPYKTGSSSKPSGCFFNKESDTKYRLDPNGVDIWWACMGTDDRIIFKTCKKQDVTCSCWGKSSCVDMWHKFDAKGSHV